MNDLPKETLRQIVVKYGKAICSDARRCEGLLNDLCGGYRREINVLVNAIEERIPLDLLAGAGSTPPELLLTRLEKRLEEQTALTPEAARWAVESWALALGVATDSEIELRRRKRSDLPAAQKETIEPPESGNKTRNQEASSIGRSGQSRPPKTQTPVPPAIAPPAGAPSRPPQSPLPSTNQPSIQPPRANPQAQSPPAVVKASRSFLLRGCLIVVFLLAVASVTLFLGLPYAIEVMRETQRERNDRPPRFPAR